MPCRAKKPRTPSPDSSYYMKKADEAFMKPYRGLPCEICGKTSIVRNEREYTTVAHHVIPKSRGRAFRYEPMNVVVLCFVHHMYSNDMAPHSFNAVAVGRFWAWLARTKPEQMAWVEANAGKKWGGEWTYKAMYEKLAASHPLDSRDRVCVGEQDAKEQ
jgi:hypothetical protein